MRTTFYLRGDEAALRLEIEALDLPENGAGLIDGARVDVDTIGEILDLTDPDTGNIIRAGAPGWHVNVQAEALPATLEGFLVDPQPATPFRVFC